MVVKSYLAIRKVSMKRLRKMSVKSLQFRIDRLYGLQLRLKSQRSNLSVGQKSKRKDLSTRIKRSRTEMSKAFKVKAEKVF